ncbi:MULTISPECIES: hypothetical protein [Prochlorococcus]|uniref:hypothetical protein n=1 Tax=Prochlorococcus TaxID=1218 RepID=UPI00053385CF|nr:MULTISPECIES: hypothetical protein [Prochlorococcus]KGG12048.1 hypothetical protein EV05_1251 [Prochlorococcus sp. MIT 0601]
MLKKSLLLIFTFTNAGLILFALCLGAQNLKERHELNLGFSSTPPYPTGFLLGLSVPIGLISGGCSAGILTFSGEDKSK